MRECLAKKQDGGKCAAPAGRTGYCHSHDPNISDEERRAVRARGGKNSSALARAAVSLPEPFQRIYDLLLTNMEGVADGSQEPQRLTALATGARAIVSLVEVGDMAQRLEEMEQSLAALKEEAQ